MSGGVEDQRQELFWSVEMSRQRPLGYALGRNAAAGVPLQQPVIRRDTELSEWVKNKPETTGLRGPVLADELGTLNTTWHLLRAYQIDLRRTQEVQETQEEEEEEEEEEKEKEKQEGGWKMEANFLPDRWILPGTERNKLTTSLQYCKCTDNSKFYQQEGSPKKELAHYLSPPLETSVSSRWWPPTPIATWERIY